jgi:CubicO group peptidase (beta-lactamase class C family)
MNPASYPVQVKDLDDIIRKACEDPNAIPGATVVVVDKAGNELFAKAVGRRGCESEEPMTLDSIYWLASCTKLLTAIACMQLVEQDRIKLDDVGELETICPELKAVKVLRDDGLLEEKKQGITLRMLLTHTGALLLEYSHQTEIDD